MLPVQVALVADRYRLDETLGAGAYGEVYAAWDTVLRRRVAIKLLTAHSDDAARRFRREARAAAGLRSPHAVPIHDVGEAADGRLYMVMEQVAGPTLRARLAAGPLPVDRALALCDQLCALLVEAHDMGLVHRDIKPGNLMLGRVRGHGEILRVLDFGVAKVSEGDGTTTRGVVGTAAYIAPEVWQEQPVDARADLYAAGLVLYEMICGEPAVKARSLHGAVKAHLFDPLPTLDPDRAPAAVARFVAHMTARDPADRPADARAARALLATVRGVSAPPEPAAPVEPLAPAAPTLMDALAADDADAFDPGSGAPDPPGDATLGAAMDSLDGPRPPAPAPASPTGRLGPLLALVGAALLGWLIWPLGAAQPTSEGATTPGDGAARAAVDGSVTRALGSDPLDVEPRRVPAPRRAEPPPADASTPAATAEAADLALAHPPRAAPSRSRRRPMTHPPAPTVALTSEPPGARVRLGEQLLGTTPLEVTVQTPLTVTVDAPDHYPAPLVLKPGQDTARVVLEPVVRLP